MLLENKNAVIYGAGGSIGSAVARAFAREGARVFLAGRTLESFEEVAEGSAPLEEWPRRRKSMPSTRRRSTNTLTL